MELLQNHIHVNVFLDLPVICVINQSDRQHREVLVTSTNVKMVDNVLNQSEINISANARWVTLVIIVKLKHRK